MPLNWASSLDQLWQTPGMAPALAMGAALFFAIVLIVVAVRASKTVANGALVLIALASTATMGYMQFRGGQAADAPVIASPGSRPPLSIAALACLDGMAGDGVEAACERVLFSSPDMTAAAVSYTAAQLSRLTPADAMTSKNQTVDGTTLRRTLERDRFGLVAQVLTIRDGCTPTACPVFKIFSDSSRVAQNMNDRTYESTIGRYALAWAGAGTTPPGASPTSPSLASASAAPAANPTTPARPSNIDFPSAASTPPVNIMIGEVPSSPTLPAARTPANAANASNPPPKQAPKKQVAAKQKAPVQLAPQQQPADDGSDEN
jgi:hypothetical protein